MKNICRILIIYFIITILIALNSIVNAAGMNITTNKSTATEGDSFNVTISGIYGKVNVSGNSNVKLSQTGSVFVDGSLTISGTAQTAGTGTITVTVVDAVTSGATPEEVTGSKSKSITIKKKETTTTTKKETSTTKKDTTTKTNTNTTKKQTTTTKKTNTETTTKKAETTKTETKEKEEATPKWGINSVKLIGVKENGEKIDIELDKKFDISTYEYSCNVASDIKKIEVEKEAYEYDEYVTITGLEQDLKDGENSIILKLAKEGQKELNYVFKVNKEAKQQETLETNAQLQENSDTNAKIEETESSATITLPIWQFILIELATIIVSAGSTVFIIKKILSKGKRVNHISKL